MTRPHLALALLLAGCGPKTADTDDTGGTTEPTVTDPTATEPAPTEPAPTEPSPTQSDPSTPGTTPTTGDTTPGDTTTGENPGGACKPADGGAEACPADFDCCSDDPAVLGGRLPNFFNDRDDDEFGPPLFAGAGNDLSFSGQCVLTGDFPSPFSNGCPVPCNPRWDAADTAEICGLSAQCCSFSLIDPARDCVLDPNTGQWRSVTGADIPALTNWGEAHTTNQDPLGTSCTEIATQSGGALDQELFEACIKELTVADRRGFCFAACPCAEDLCDMKNPGWVPRCN